MRTKMAGKDEVSQNEIRNGVECNYVAAVRQRMADAQKGRR